MKTSIKNILFVMKCSVLVSRFRLIVEFFLAISGVLWTLTNMFFWKYILDGIVGKASFSAIVLYVSIYIFIFIIVNYYRDWANESYIPRSNLAIREYFNEEIFLKTKDMDLSDYASGTYYNNFVWIVENIDKKCIEMVSSFFCFIENIILLSIICAVSVYLEPVLILFNLLYVLLSAYLEIKINKVNFIYGKERSTIARRADYAKRIHYLPQYAQELRTFHGLHTIIQEIYDESVNMETICIKEYGPMLARLYILSNVLRYALSSYIPYLYLGIKAVATGVYTVGNFSLLTDTSIALKNGIQGVFSYITKTQEQNQYINNYHTFMEKEPAIHKNEGGKTPYLTANALEIKNVSFRYDEKSDYVLHHINMKIKAGEKVAIVGYNGAGKSTFVKLLLRLYLPESGEIYMDGVEAGDYKLSSYRERFATVFQDFKLYALPIPANIQMQKGKHDPEETEQLMNILDQVGLKDKVSALKDGLESVMTHELSENGVELSGGESQKIAIARVYRKDAGIIILDEPSSALDPVSEEKIFQTMMKAAEGKTVILISHRLSATKDADMIYYFEHGSIVESGNHEELMQKHGKYAEMFEIQAKNYLDT